MPTENTNEGKMSIYGVREMYISENAVSYNTEKQV